MLFAVATCTAILKRYWRSTGTMRRGTPRLPWRSTSMADESLRIQRRALPTPCGTSTWAGFGLHSAGSSPCPSCDWNCGHVVPDRRQLPCQEEGHTTVKDRADEVRLARVQPSYDKGHSKDYVLQSASARPTAQYIPHQSNREHLSNFYHLRQSSGRTPAAFSSKIISLLESLKLSFPMFPDLRCRSHSHQYQTGALLRQSAPG